MKDVSKMSESELRREVKENRQWFKEHCAVLAVHRIGGFRLDADFNAYVPIDRSSVITEPGFKGPTGEFMPRDTE